MMDSLMTPLALEELGLVGQADIEQVDDLLRAVADFEKIVGIFEGDLAVLDVLPQVDGASLTHSVPARLSRHPTLRALGPPAVSGLHPLQFDYKGCAMVCQEFSLI